MISIRESALRRGWFPHSGSKGLAALIIPFGVLGLVLANTAQFAFHALVMYLLARKRISAFRIEGLWNTAARSSIAAAIMAGAVLLTVFLVRSGVGEVRFVARSAIVVAGVGVGAVVYVAAAWLLRIDEVRYFGAVLRARIRRTAD